MYSFLHNNALNLVDLVGLSIYDPHIHGTIPTTKVIAGVELFGSQNEPSCANSDSYVEVNHASTWVAYTEWKKVATETALKHARVVSSNVINCYHTSANVTFIGEFPYAGAMSYNTPGKYDATWRNETERKEVFKRLDLPIVE